MYWKLLLPTKYAFQRSITNGIFSPVEQKFYTSDIMGPLMVVDNDSYSNLLLSSSPELDNDFVVSETSSTAALSVPDSATSSWETPDPGLVVTELIIEFDFDTGDIAYIDAS